MKLKKLHLAILFLLCPFVGYSCGGEKEITTPAEDLKLEKNSLVLEENETVSIKIISGNGSYKKSTSPMGIVSAHITGDLIDITALEIGNTTLTVTDARDKSASIAIGVKEVEIDNAPPPMARGFMSTRPEHLSLQTIQEMKNWGANLIRIQITPVRWAFEKQQDIWVTLPSYLEMMQERIDHAASLGMKVVIDLHEPPILKDGKLTDAAYWGSDEFWNRTDLLPNFITLWEKIAEKFKSAKYNKIIYGYDIYNEPQQNSGIPYVWREQMAQPIVDAIREIDKDVWIIYEPGPWGNTTGYQTFNNKPLLPLEDDRLIYSVHYYTPQLSLTHVGLDEHRNAGKFTREQALQAINKVYPGILDNSNKVWNKQALRETLQPVIDFQTKYNVPIYVGEFSIISWVPVQSSVNWLTDVISLFEELKWAWSYHAFREWQGWSLEHPEGIEAFWFSNQTSPGQVEKETERAKVIKEAFKKNR